MEFLSHFYKKNSFIIIVFCSLIFIAFLVSNFNYNRNLVSNKENQNIIINDVDNKSKEGDIILDKKEDDIIDFIFVDIKGSITNPNVYKLKSGTRMNELIEIAGGFKEANIECINLSKILTDELMVIIPNLEMPCSSNDKNNIDQILVNINTADNIELQTLPGIGLTRANDIISYRNNTNFNNLEDLKNVKGIGESIFLKLKAKITI